MQSPYMKNVAALAIARVVWVVSLLSLGEACYRLSTIVAAGMSNAELAKISMTQTIGEWIRVPAAGFGRQLRLRRDAPFD